MQHSPQQLKELYLKLPRKVQDAIFSEETSDTLHEIGQKRKLHVDQVGAIADEVGEVLLGIASRESIASAIAKRANVPKEVAQDVANEIAAKIFAPIQEHLRGSTGGEEDMVTLPSYEQEKMGGKPLSSPKTIPQAAAPLAGATPGSAATLPEDASPFMAPPPATPPSATPAPPTEGAAQKPASGAANFIGGKLGGVTYGGAEKGKEEPKPAAPPPEAFVADPYREPIE